MKKIFIIILVLIGVLSSCNNEIELYGGGDPVPIVYCLLNPNADVQYVRLSRSYKTDSSLVGVSPSADSTRWDLPVEIYIEKYNDLDDPEEVIWFQPSTASPKDSGFFAENSFELYEADFSPEAGDTYSLYVYFPELQKMVSARTIVMSLSEVIDPMNVLNRALTFDSLASMYLRWIPALNGGLYQGIFRFHYAEIDGDNRQNLFVDFPTPIFSEFSSKTIVEKKLNPNNLYKYLGQQIQPNPDIRRKPIGIEYLFYSTGSDLGLWFNTLNDGTTTQTTIYEYTNVEGGRGIFSSWITQRIPNLPLSKVTLRNLATHPLTKDLGFEE